MMIGRKVTVKKHVIDLVLDEIEFKPDRDVDLIVINAEQLEEPRDVAIPFHRRVNSEQYRRNADDIHKRMRTEEILEEFKDKYGEKDILKAIESGEIVIEKYFTWPRSHVHVPLDNGKVWILFEGEHLIGSEE